jgi:Domain of unknown function (DUF4135)
MDLIQLRADLARLRVTLTSSTDPANIAAVLPGQREYRASLYMPQLLDVEDFLTNPNRLAQAVGPLVTQFVKPALDSFDYNALALQYDFWIGPAVQLMMDNANVASIAAYQNYFINNILDAIPANYNNNLNNNFYTPYPIMRHLLTQLTANLRNNLQQACTRIYNDRNRIADLFNDQYPALELLNLTGIAPTGSDFHKGGQQVLILTFSTRWWWGPGQGLPWWSDLKVVYKPADMEVDCLIVGNSAAANRALGNPAFLNASLVEIFNTEAANNPGPNLKPLPTYRILPMNRTSAQPGPPAQVPIRNAYGYLEYLGYEWTGIPVPVFNYYLTGASDYMIYRNQPEAPIITDFYHQIGHWVAITTLFSIGDLHGENVRVRGYQPHLIDLEISLTEPFNNVADSGLFASFLGLDIGGITGELNNREDWVWYVTVAPPHVDLDKPYITKHFQNRLCALRPGKKTVPVNPFLLLQGLRAGMVNLRGCHPSLAGWFGRLNNVLVRVLPYGTQDWKSIRAEVYSGSLGQPGPPQVNPTIQEVLQSKLDIEFAAYNPVGPGLPDFIVMQPGTIPAPAAAATDLRNFDIPAFYHRIGTTELLDSNGNVIAVPGQVIVHDNNVPPQLVQQNTNAPHPTYFGVAAPTTAVRNNQVNPIANPNINAFINLVGQMENQTISPAALNVAMPPDAGVLIP